MPDTFVLIARSWFIRQISVRLPRANRSFVVFPIRLMKKRVDGLLQKPRPGIVGDFNHGKNQASPLSNFLLNGRAIFSHSECYKALAEEFGGYVDSE